jgi:hypothetical protein
VSATIPSEKENTALPARFVIVGLGMDSRKPDPTAEPAPKSGPLTELVEKETSDSIVSQVADELEKREEEPPRSGASDYARGTAEHEDDSEA